MAHPKSCRDVAASQPQAAAAQKWRHLLPAEGDEEEQRERKMRQLMKLQHVKGSHLGAARASQQKQVQQQPCVHPPSEPKRRRDDQEQRPPLALPPEQQQQQPLYTAQAGWRGAVRSAGEQEHRKTEPAAAAPEHAAAAAAEASPETSGAGEQQAVCTAAAAEAESGAAAEFHTPLSTRMLPGPGKAAKPLAGSGQAASLRGASGGSAEPASSSGRPSAAPSSGIPTLPSSAGTSRGAAAVAQQRAGRRRLPPAEPALGSGRLPLSAGGFLSAGRPAAAAQPASGGPQQQQRRWRQQQQLQAQPLARILHKQPAQPALQLSQLSLEGSGGGGAFQPARPSRFAPPEPATVFAPVSLTTQLGPSQAPGPSQAGTQQVVQPPAAVSVERQQRQQQQQQLQQQPQQQPPEEEEEQQQRPQQPQQPQQPPQQQQQPPQQQQLQQQPPQQQQQQRARAAAVPAMAAAPALGTEWTLPPTPSCMHGLSPSSPAPAAQEGGPGSSVQRGQPAGGSTAGQRLRRAAAAAAAGTEPDSLLARLPDFTLSAETPLLLASPGSAQHACGSERQQAAEGSGQRLFVAETPADSAAACPPDKEQRRRSHLAPAPQLASALEAAAAAKTPAAVAAAAGPAAQAAPSETPVGLAAPVPAVTPAVAAAAAAAAAAAGGVPATICGLQLQLPQPVLQAVPCADGRHVALLLGNFAPAGEPSDVLVLQLPEQPPAAAAGGVAQQADGADAIADADSCCGVRVVASLAVQRSRWASGMDLTPNCLQLAATEKAGLQLVLSAALELPDEPRPQQPAILVLPLGGARDSSPTLPEALAPGQPAQARGRRRRGTRLLSIECREHHPLTCVLLADGGTLLAAGDGCGDVRRLQFDPLWRSYTWGRDLPPAHFRHIALEDLQQLVLYCDPEPGSAAPPRSLLLGISGGGTVALWDYGSSELLAVKSSHRFRVRALHPVSAVQAGLTTPVKQRVAAGGAAASASPSPTGVYLFVGLAQERESGEQHVAAVMLCPSGLMVSSRGALAPPRLQPGRRQAQHQQADRATAVAAVAGGTCWLGTASGELLPWDLAGGHGSGAAAALAAPGGRVHGCSGGGAVTAVCTLPGAEWRLVAATAGGALLVL